MSNHLNIFTSIYENKIWGDNNEDNYNGSSGSGSSVEYNIKTYIPFLKKFIKDYNINTVVDLGCGDFRCGKHIYEDFENIIYCGYDAYEKIVQNNQLIFFPPKYSFIHSDFYEERNLINEADLCILKDVLQHWSLQKIYSFLDYIIQVKKFKYILLVNCCNQSSNDTDIYDGECRGLSCDYFPLKKYNPIKLYKYETKEISLITLNI